MARQKVEMVWLLLRHERLLLPAYGKRRGDQVGLLSSVNGFRFPCMASAVGRPGEQVGCCHLLPSAVGSRLGAATGDLLKTMCEAGFVE